MVNVFFILALFFLIYYKWACLEHPIIDTTWVPLITHKIYVQHQGTEDLGQQSIQAKGNDELYSYNLLWVSVLQLFMYCFLTPVL